MDEKHRKDDQKGISEQEQDGVCRFSENHIKRGAEAEDKEIQEAQNNKQVPIEIPTLDSRSARSEQEKGQKHFGNLINYFSVVNCDGNDYRWRSRVLSILLYQS